MSWDDPTVASRQRSRVFATRTRSPPIPGQSRLRGVGSTHPCRNRTSRSGPTRRGSRTTGGDRATDSISIDQQTIGNVIAVLPDGARERVRADHDGQPTMPQGEHLAVIRSTDGGDTWSRPWARNGHRDRRVRRQASGRRAKRRRPRRSRSTRERRCTSWEDDRFAPAMRDSVAISRSLDSGLTWSPPAQVSGAPSAGVTDRRSQRRRHRRRVLLRHPRRRRGRARRVPRPRGSRRRPTAARPDRRAVDRRLRSLGLADRR